MTVSEFRKLVDSLAIDALIENEDALYCPSCNTLLVHSPYAWEKLTAAGIDCDTITGSCFESQCGQCHTSWFDNPKNNPIMAECYTHITPDN